MLRSAEGMTINAATEKSHHIHSNWNMRREVLLATRQFPVVEKETIVSADEQKLCRNPLWLELKVLVL
jgi:hypothetical protein